MANKDMEKVGFDAECLKGYMEQKDISLKQLSKLLQRDESTVRGYLKEGKMPRRLRDKLWRYLAKDDDTQKIILSDDPKKRRRDKIEALEKYVEKMEASLQRFKKQLYWLKEEYNEQ